MPVTVEKRTDAKAKVQFLRRIIFSPVTAYTNNRKKSAHQLDFHVRIGI